MSDTAKDALNAREQTTETVGRTEDWTLGSMKMKTVGDRQVAVVLTESGFHAIDNACPHQGYGLTTGALSGELVTCQWHNWKFDVRTGRCVIGEEDVTCHGVDIVDGEVAVTVTSPTIAEQRGRLWPSLERGMRSNYVGQIARDSVRLLETGVGPAEIMAAGLTAAAARTKYGIGHELAMAADCLALAEIRHGTERALPLVQGLAGMAEVTRERQPRSVPDPESGVDVAAAIEAEDVRATMAGLLGAIEDGVEPSTIRHHMIEAASAHHLSYGHGMIYTQKTFEILDRIGWDKAPDVLPHLGAAVVWSTREDSLPYMSKAMRALAAVDLNKLAGTTGQDGWSAEALASTFLDATEAPIAEAVAAAEAGAGVEGIIDAVTLAASRRLLRHNLDVEFAADTDGTERFGWLDITHALTLSEAVRWAWRCDPGPHTARAALFAVWLVFDSGRSERRLGVVEPTVGDGRPGSAGLEPEYLDGPEAVDLSTALLARDAHAAVAHSITGDRERVGSALAEASLDDRAGSFIVTAHLIKTTEAARREAEVLDSSLPLAATARFLAAPRLERFVAANVRDSVDFITTGRPPKR